MTFWILTLFPQTFEGFLSQSILKRAQNKKVVKVNLVDIRNFTSDPRKTVDDKPYGGGKGMILKVEPVVKALESIKPKPTIILLSASGRKYNQKIAKVFSKKKSLAIICGHYEGVDARVEDFVDEVITIGDFILTGGEVAAMAIVDSTTRLIPGVIKKESLEMESFSQLSTLLEYPQYTRPPNFRGKKVPQVLLSGNHESIKLWRQEQSIKITKKRRPDLLGNH